MPAIIGRRRFRDGATRDIFFDDEGRQFVQVDCLRIFGVWIHPDLEPDRPLIVPRCEPLTEQIEIGYPLFVIGPERLASRGPIGSAMQSVDGERGRCLLLFDSVATALEAAKAMQAGEALAVLQIDDRTELDALLAAHEKSGATTLAYNLRFVEGQPKARFISARELRSGVAFFLAMGE